MGPAYIPISKHAAKSLSASIHSGPPSLFQDYPDDTQVPPRKIESANYFAVGYGVLRVPASKGYYQVLLEYGPSGSHGQLSRSPAMFDALKNRVGGETTRAQIYSFFHQQRRVPNGEFVLRMLDFLALLRGLQAEKMLAAKLELESEWRHVESALEIEEDAAEARSAQLKQRLQCRIRRARFRPRSEPFSILRRLRKSAKIA
jgi:hypothetical protein